MVVFAILFGLFQCLAMATWFVAFGLNAPDPFLSAPLIWLAILFGPATYLFARDVANPSIINLVVAIVTVVAIVLGLTPGRFTLFPYYHQILSMGAIVSVLAIASYNSPWSPGSPGKRPVLIGILASGPVIGATIWLTLLSGPIVAFQAAETANRQSYCIFNYSTRLIGLGEYRQSSSVWDFEAYWMTSPFISGGGSDEFQFGFHGLLLTSNELFNWSYQSQRFDRVTDTSRRKLHIRNISCSS
jgi:hypothetical protein